MGQITRSTERIFSFLMPLPLSGCRTDFVFLPLLHASIHLSMHPVYIDSNFTQ